MQEKKNILNIILRHYVTETISVSLKPPLGCSCFRSLPLAYDGLSNVKKRGGIIKL